MLTSGNGWQQAWNRQMAVDMDSHLIVGGHISQAPNDTRQLEPMLNELEALPEEVGAPTRSTADNGYYSTGNISEATDRTITPCLATGRQKHNQHFRERTADPGPPPEEATEAEQMGGGGRLQRAKPSTGSGRRA